MKTRHFISSILIALGLLMGLCTVITAVSALDAPVRMVKTPKAALQRVDTMMAAICEGDDEKASAQIYGAPSFGAVPENASESVRMAWEIYRKSFSYGFQGSVKPNDSGVSIDVNVKHLDLTAVMAELERSIQALMDEKAAAAQEDESGFSASRKLRQKEVEAVIQKAFSDALENQGLFQEQLITIDLVYDRGQWWALPNQDLTNMLSGSFPE